MESREVPLSPVRTSPLPTTAARKLRQLGSARLTRFGSPKHHDRLLRVLVHSGVGAIDVDALLRQLPRQLRECAGLVCQFKLFQRALGVREPRPEPSWLC